MQQVLKRFAKKADLASLKSDVDESDIDELKNVSSGLDSVQRKVDKLDVDKLVPAPTHFKKVMQLIMKFLKKMCMMNLLKNVNTIDTGRLVKKQIIMVRSMRLKVKYLVLLAQLLLALNAVQNKMPVISNLVKNKYYDAKVSDIEFKYFNILHYSSANSYSFLTVLKYTKINILKF